MYLPCPQFDALRTYYVMCGNYHEALLLLIRLTETNDTFAEFIRATEDVCRLGLRACETCGSCPTSSLLAPSYGEFAPSSQMQIAQRFLDSRRARGAGRSG